MKLIPTCIFVLLVAAVPLAADNQPANTLATAYEDIPPKYIQHPDGSFGGLAVELMELISRETGIAFSAPDEFVPKLRYQAQLDAGEIDVFFGLRTTEDRLEQWVFGEPLYRVRYLAVQRQGDPAVVRSVQDILEIGEDTVVLTVAAAASQEILQEKGLLVDARAIDVQSNIRKLVAGRGRVFVYQNLSTLFELNRSPYRDELRVTGIGNLDSYDHYVVFSPDSSPGHQETINNAIVRLRNTPEWQGIVQRYLGE